MNVCLKIFLHEQITSSNIASEEDIFSKRKQNKKYSKTKLDRKNLPFHDAFDHFVFLYISTAWLGRRLPDIVKDDSSEGL